MFIAMPDASVALAGSSAGVGRDGVGARVTVSQRNPAATRSRPIMRIVRRRTGALAALGSVTPFIEGAMSCMVAPGPASKQFCEFLGLAMFCGALIFSASSSHNELLF
jgi:hypothetical protein